MSSDANATRRSAVPALLLRPRAQDRGLFAKANTLFRGYHLGAYQTDSVTDAVRSYGRPFLVDPQTYIFSLSPSRHRDAEKTGLRRTSETLSSAYGEPFASTVGVRRVVPEDLGDPQLLADSVSRVLAYQRDKALGQMGLPLDPYYEKYRIWDGEPGAAGLIPQILIPPYFYFKGPLDPWLDVNLAAARQALEFKRGQERVYPVLLFSEKLLDDEALVDATVAAYLAEPFDGYFLWPNRFDESRQTADRLRALASMISNLAASGRRVSKLYGGYWSVLMGPRGLGGVSCGLGCSSSKNAFAYGGRNGKTIRNYYIPRLHLSVPLEEASRILEAEPRLLCTCSVCSETFGGRVERFGAMAEGSRCEGHFLNARRQEMGRVSDEGTLGALRDLKETCKNLRASSVGTEFLEVWARALAS